MYKITKKAVLNGKNQSKQTKRFKMFTTKQRSNLRSLAQTIDAIGQVGKGGISQNQIEFFKEAISTRELIKITVLNNSEADVKELSTVIADSIGAEVVCVIGHKIVLYKYSDKKGVKHVEF